MLITMSENKHNLEKKSFFCAHNQSDDDKVKKKMRKEEKIKSNRSRSSGKKLSRNVELVNGLSITAAE